MAALRWGEAPEIEGDEQEEVASGVFLPGGVVLTPRQAMSAVFLGGDHGWGAPVVVRLRAPGSFVRSSDESSAWAISPSSRMYGSLSTAPLRPPS